MAKKQWPPTLRNPWGGHKSAGLVGAPESSDAPPAKGRRGRASRAGADERRDQSGLGPQGRTAVKRAVHEMDPSGKRGRGKAPDMWRGMIAPIIENPHARHGKPELTFQQQEYKTPRKPRAARKEQRYMPPVDALVPPHKQEARQRAQAEAQERLTGAKPKPEALTPLPGSEGARMDPHLPPSVMNLRRIYGRDKLAQALSIYSRDRLSEAAAADGLPSTGDKAALTKRLIESTDNPTPAQVEDDKLFYVQRRDQSLRMRNFLAWQQRGRRDERRSNR